MTTSINDVAVTDCPRCAGTGRALSGYRFCVPCRGSGCLITTTAFHDAAWEVNPSC